MSDLHIELCEMISAEARWSYDAAAEWLENIPQNIIAKIKTAAGGNIKAYNNLVLGYLFESVIDAEA